MIASAAPKQGRILRTIFRCAQKEGMIPLAVDPDGAIGEVLFLPDGHFPLQAIDRFQGGVECRFAMGSRSGDDHARLSYLQRPEPVNDADVADSELSYDFSP